MRQTHQTGHSHRRHRSATGDMLTHAGLEGLLASIPTVVVITVRDSLVTGLQSSVHRTLAKGEKAAGEAVNEAAGHINLGRFSMNAPVTVAAVIIGAALVHGAWRGKRKHEERSFAQAEEERRAQRGSTEHSGAGR